MRELVEIELKLARVEGLLCLDGASGLGEEALRLERSPLELLREQGQLSEESFLSLRAEAREALPEATPSGRSCASLPDFPVEGWERYQCVRFLGQGGMGRVFLARDPRLCRNVALKFVREEDAQLTHRFIAEARAQARVNHERVCKVYEVGEVQGRVYIAMQYIEGRPLHTLAGRLTLEQKVRLLRDTAEGVDAAHRAGLLHRDIKPSNILVGRTAEGGLEPYVMDFGLACDREEGGGPPGAVLGTPHYMAPEQARGELATLDRRADVYSLGATLYSLLTARTPIQGDTPQQVLENLSTAAPLPPRALCPHLPADLEAIVLKCLAKEPSARYDSARALAEDLERFLAGAPVLAPVSDPCYRLRKRLRRHGSLVSMASASLLVMGLVLGWARMHHEDGVSPGRGCVSVRTP